MEYMYVTTFAVDNTILSSRDKIQIDGNIGGLETAKKHVAKIAKLNDISLQLVVFSIIYPGYADEDTESHGNKFSPKDILKIIFDEYLNYTPWTRNEKFGKKEDFF